MKKKNRRMKRRGDKEKKKSDQLLFLSVCAEGEPEERITKNENEENNQ